MRTLNGVVAISIVIAETLKTILKRITINEIIPKEIAKFPILNATIVLRNAPEMPIKTQKGKEITTLCKSVLNGISANKEIKIG